MIVLDASVLIAHLDGGDAAHERAQALLLAWPQEPLGASTVTLAEILVGPARAGKLPQAKTALSTLGISEIGLGADAPERLAAMRAQTRLKLPDCCVLLAALDASAAWIATFDQHLAVAATTQRLAVLDGSSPPSAGSPRPAPEQ